MNYNRYSTIIRSIAYIFFGLMLIGAIVLAAMLESFWYFPAVSAAAALFLIGLLSYAQMIEDISESTAHLENIEELLRNSSRAPLPMQTNQSAASPGVKAQAPMQNKANSGSLVAVLIDLDPASGRGTCSACGEQQRSDRAVCQKCGAVFVTE